MREFKKYQQRLNFSAFVQGQLFKNYYFFNVNLLANEKNNKLFFDDTVILINI